MADEVATARRWADAHDTAGLRAIAQDAMGVGDLARPVRRAPWAAERRHGVAALGMTAAAPLATSLAAAVYGPELAHALHFTSAGVGGLVALLLLAAGLGSPATAALSRLFPQRLHLIAAYTLAFGAAALAASRTSPVLFACLAAVALGLATASTPTLHIPFLIDGMPPPLRFQAVAVHAALRATGAAVLITGTTVLLSGTEGTVRSALVLLGLAAALSAGPLLRVRLAPRPHAEALEVAEAISHGAATAEDLDRIERPTVVESLRQAMALPTMRELRTPRIAAGMLSVPLLLTMSFFLTGEEGIGTGGRGALAIAVLLVTSIALVALTCLARSPFRAGPVQLSRLGAVLFASGGMVLPAAMLVPGTAIRVVLFGYALVAFALAAIVLDTITMAVTPPVLRQAAASISGLYLFAAGGVAGIQSIGTIERRFGTPTAISLLALPALGAAVAMLRAALTELSDLNRTVDELIDHAQVATQARRGVHTPLLACRGIDFSYGELQVLFGVDFTVDDGEMVALLGTNGAGKSTLLRAISGLSLPTTGTIRLRGTDITRTLPERRLELGITQIQGGRAVFRSLTVVENLRLFGYSHGRDRARVERGIEASLDAFPRLAERRNQAASTLSGGEQQMLALSKALIVPPQLLLVDELSLGLAPIVVAGLLEMVRSINAAGTAVVLVEQSVNVALSLVEHAYFMEKGEIRFDGPAPDLLAREDLLRSVFLEGVAQGGTPRVR